MIQPLLCSLQSQKQAHKSKASLAAKRHVLSNLSSLTATRKLVADGRALQGFRVSWFTAWDCKSRVWDWDSPMCNPCRTGERCINIGQVFLQMPLLRNLLLSWKAVSDGLGCIKPACQASRFGVLQNSETLIIFPSVTGACSMSACTLNPLRPQIWERYGA